MDPWSALEEPKLWLSYTVICMEQVPVIVLKKKLAHDVRLVIVKKSTHKAIWVPFIFDIKFKKKEINILIYGLYHIEPGTWEGEGVNLNF